MTTYSQSHIAARAVIALALVASSIAACSPTVPGITLRTVRIVGVSMSPTLNAGDIATLEPIAVTDLHRGDVVVMADPFDSTKFFVKRVIALPGDRLEIVRGTVFVKPIAEARWYMLKEQYLNTLEPWTISTSWPYSPDSDRIPDGSLFVLGDNRNHSTDSRVFGPISFADSLSRFDRGEGRISRVVGGRSDLGRPQLEQSAGPPATTVVMPIDA